ncbi:PGF-pre-PGF domain-containing protein [Halorussus sp. MSC15.2]|uniref:PGF-pre-PGF domain-containing protein n=1 Tax=Halorussus sp. MSC15.2 TaxID=2283638 RepID=UPI0013D0D058|nr:PGF-pre-PGF domain-containing protein [Halorussus sp. MSC15.2]NEU58468.1 PGF-pre-PGF domain-containing protein [Halorussus sp. MSC15.2]
MADFDADNRIELPYVANETVEIVDGGGERQQLATDVTSTTTLLGVGDWDGNGRVGVLYANASAGDEIYRAEVGATPQRVLDVPVSAVLGVASFDGDGDEDIVFLGESRGIKYFDDGQVRSTGYYDVNENGSVGSPTDFDGDGVARVPVLSEGDDLLLVGASGETTVVKSDYTSASASTLAGFDWVGDASPEIIHFGTDGQLRYATLDGSVGPVRDANGSVIAANPTVGVSAYPATNRTSSDDETTTLIESLDETTSARTTHEVTYVVGENSTEAGNALDSVEVQYPNESADVQNVSLRDVTAGIDRDGDGDIDVGLNATDAIDAVTAVENSTLRVAFNATHTLQANDTIVVRYAGVINPDTDDVYSVSVTLNDATTRSGSLDIDASVSGTVEATVTRVGPNEISITAPTVDSGGRLTADIPETELAETTGTRLSRLNLTFAADAHTNATLVQTRNVSVPAVGANDSNVTGLSHFRLSGASPTSEAVENARFRFSVNSSAFSEDPDELGLYRYVNDSWSRLPTALVAVNDSTFTFVADSPGVGRFAVATEDGLHQAPTAIESVEFINRIDRNGDGNLSDFALEIEANTSLRLDHGSGGDPYYEVYVDGERHRILGVTPRNESNETVVLSSRQLESSADRRNVRVVLWDDDEYDRNESGRDKADTWSSTVAYESVESDATTEATNLSVAIDSGGIYAEMHNRSLNASYWKQKERQYANRTAKNVRDELESRIEGLTYHTYNVEDKNPLQRKGMSFAKTSEGILSIPPYELSRTAKKSYSNLLSTFSRAQTLENAISSGSYFIRGAQSHAVARHLDDPGYNSRNYTRLHENLRALSENSDELEAARAANDTARVNELLEERKVLLNETYQSFRRTPTRPTRASSTTSWARRTSSPTK